MSPSIYPLNPDAPTFNPATTTRTAYQDTQDHQRDSFLATSIANAMDRNRLPEPTPKPFSGDPMEYISFKRSFKTLTEKKAISAEEKIYYLQQYLQGDTKQAVAGCFYGTQESDYHQAWQTLEKRFGHSFRIQESFREKLEDWPKLNIKDCTGLQRYADILKSCLDAMPHINGLQVLNDCKENQKIVSKLPDPLIARWSRIVTEYMNEHAAYPLFSRFVSFVEKEARVACNPIASFAAVKGQVHNFKPNKEEKNKARTLTVNTKQHAPSEPKEKRSNDEKVCPYCKGNHYLPNCEQFQAKDHEEKTSYIREAKRCFGCLRTGHFSHACPDCHKCRTCHRSHPTVLHRELETSSPTKWSQTSNQAETQQKVNALSTCTGSSNTTNVMPVWISTKENPRVEKLVYALLDTQSDSSFIEENLCAQLAAATEPCKLKVTTLLGKDVTVECQKASSLRVRGYTSTHVIDLPPTYTRDFIPFDREHIPTCETAKKWDHFESIAAEIPPLLDIDIGLLIGYNCSNALVPREVIAGKSTEPYAVKTDLGWSIVGSISPSSVSETTGFCYRVSAREVPMMNPTDALNLLQSNFKDTNQNDKSACISQDDIQFSEILEKGIHTNELSHLEIPFPCKTTEYKPPTGVKTNLMVGGPEMKGKTVGETEIKGKMMGETEIKSKNEKVDQTAQVIEIKDSCVVLQDKAYCTGESLSKEKPNTEAQNVKNVTEVKADTVVTETVKMPNKTDTQEDRKTKAQTWYKGEASSIVTTNIPIDFVSDDVRVRSQDKVSKESRTQKATRPTPIPPPRRKSRSPKKRHASKPQDQP